MSVEEHSLQATGGCPVDHSAAGGSPVESFGYPSLDWNEWALDYFKALRAEGVYQRPGTNDFVVSRWEDIVYVLERPEVFTSSLSHMPNADKIFPNPTRLEGQPSDTELGYPTTLMALTDPPHHRNKRMFGHRMLTREKLAAYEPVIQRLVDELVDDFIDRGQFEFSEDFAESFPIRVICEILGLPMEDAPLLHKVSNNEAAGARYLSPEELAQQMDEMQQLCAYVDVAIRERIEHPEQHHGYLLEMIELQREQDDELRIPVLVTEGLELLISGNVTTTHGLASVMRILLDNPGEMQKVIDDRSLIPKMFEEALRIEAPVPWVSRFVKEDTEINGTRVPAGAVVQWYLGSGNMDPEKFEDPEKFWIERPRVLKDHLAFGRGIHRCVGAPLARLEAVLTFNTFFDRMKNFRYVPGTEHPPYYRSHSHRAPASLRVAFDRND